MVQQWEIGWINPHIILSHSKDKDETSLHCKLWFCIIRKQNDLTVSIASVGIIYKSYLKHQKDQPIVLLL